MQFPTVASSVALAEGDLVTVMTKAYGDRVEQHYVLVDCLFEVDGVPYMHITDLHFGFTTTLSRRIVSSEDEFWTTILPADPDEALDSFKAAYSEALRRFDDAQNTVRQAALAVDNYRTLAERLALGGLL